MTQSNAPLVGNSFKLGYRFQRYWDTSMAIAFFAAEAGTGLFLVSFLINYIPGMIFGLAIAGTLKPYFHLTHMGVPGKSWRAMIRPDRSWISRGAIAVGVLIGCGILYVADRAYGIGMPHAVATLLGYLAVAGALVVMCYQGMAMSDSESFTLWASPLLPLASFAYSVTAGVLATLALGWNTIAPTHKDVLATMAWIMPLVDLALVYAILAHASSKSRGGAFSVELLRDGEYAAPFRNLVVLMGQVLPAAVLLVAGGARPAVVLALAAMLIGFFAFRLLMFRAAVFEPITHDLAGSIGIPNAR